MSGSGLNRAEEITDIILCGENKVSNVCNDSWSTVADKQIVFGFYHQLQLIYSYILLLKIDNHFENQPPKHIQDAPHQ